MLKTSRVTRLILMGSLTIVLVIAFMVVRKRPDSSHNNQSEPQSTSEESSTERDCCRASRYDSADDHSADEDILASISEYITPEQFGAKGDGKTDDTKAFEKCMKSAAKNVYLRNTYMITKNIVADSDKYIFAQPNHSASINCHIKNDTKGLTFPHDVTIENVTIYSELMRKSMSPHGEIYQRTSEISFIEVWNRNNKFINCDFYNGLVAIRGRKSVNAKGIPEHIDVENCTFTECKIPIQGYSSHTRVHQSTFLNDGVFFQCLSRDEGDAPEYGGDVYSGDHCVYIERYGCVDVTVTECDVKTLNSESGAAFQIYGSPREHDDIPSLTVEGCTLHANGVASASAAHVMIKNVEFHEQKDAKFIASVEAGSLTVMDSTFYHSYAFTYADSTVKPVAKNCKFYLDTSLTRERCNFPAESYRCEYINWGGNVRVEPTVFSECKFTKTNAHVLGRLYVRNTEGYSVTFDKTTFSKGDTVTDHPESVSQ